MTEPNEKKRTNVTIAVVNDTLSVKELNKLVQCIREIEQNKPERRINVLMDTPEKTVKEMEVNMAPETLYPIQIPFNEREIIKGILLDRRDKISSLWKQFTDKNNEIYITVFQNGFMIGALASQRNTVPECWKQLIDTMNKIKKDAGVEETDMGNNIVKLKDSSGFAIIRQKREWEG